MSTRDSLTVQLPNAQGTLTLSGTFNAFDLVGDERALVFVLLDLMQDFEAKGKDLTIDDRSGEANARAIDDTKCERLERLYALIARDPAVRSNALLRQLVEAHGLDAELIVKASE